MTIFSEDTAKKIARIVLITGAASLTAACGGHGPNTYLMAKDAVAAKLEGAEREFTFDGRDKRIIRSVRRSGDMVRVKLTYTTGSLGSVTCEARVEAVDEDWSHVDAVCPTSGSASDNLQGEINEMQIEEFVEAVLYDKPVDASMVLKRTSAVAIDNIGEVINEAEQKARETTYASAPSDTGWTEDGSGSDWGN